ncbi:MAG: hypothetical protein E6G06_15490 [Actinobacteria bacterium]|nr:MAG: hypothetical protein E6G06_15490 [Actinomycetota bacterium]
MRLAAALAHAHHSPARSKICRRRRMEKLGPDRQAIHLDVAASTIYRVLRRHDRNRLSHLDRQTATPIRRHERARPGERVHVDVKKLGRIPAGDESEARRGGEVLARAQPLRLCEHPAHATDTVVGSPAARPRARLATTACFPPTR